MNKTNKNSVTLTLTLNDRSFSKLFKAFGDPTRLKILRLLASKEMTVNEIVAEVGLSQPTISRHLSILREAEIVEDRRDGQNVIYSLIKQNVESCCSGFCDCLEIPVKSSKKRKKSK
jgi:DNA-binding transcriptional ArsR family regulator